MSDLSETIESNAQDPRRAAGDGQSAEQHSLPDQIEAARFAATQRALKSRSRGIHATKLKPPGAC